MSASARLRLLLRLPPQVVARRAWGLAQRKARHWSERWLDSRRRTHGPVPDGQPHVLLAPPDLDRIRSQAGWIRPLAALYRDCWVDLLGSGWVRPRHGMTCAGLDTHRFPPGATVAADTAGRWLEGRVTKANLEHSRRVWALVSPDWRPVDWHLDLKSGWRWPDRQWHADIVIGHPAGADVKLPWELARMQHLAVLGWSYLLDGNAADARAFRDQVLDFIAANPPRFGVCWRCPMDVAIRAANWVMAFELFRAGGHAFDQDFVDVLKASLADHGRFVVNHLEWYPEGRGNHYLADICGLLFIAAWLPESDETRRWLAFAAQELAAESAYQVQGDGSVFEASTPYHRLTGEMLALSTALLDGVAARRPHLLDQVANAGWRCRPHRPLADRVAFPWAEQRARLARMAAFTRAVSKPDHRIAQIGDNDSGRFLRLHPIVTEITSAEARVRYANLAGWRALNDDQPYWDEDLLDHRAFAALAETVAGVARGLPWLDAVAAEALMAGPPPPCPAAMPAAVVGTWADTAPGTPFRIEIRPGGTDLRDGLESLAFADFGVYVLRSRRVWLAVRCGSIGLMGRGGHAHNDQLALELSVDGMPWLADPGTYVYTADRAARNAWRSVRAHAAPRLGAAEPGSLALGDFWLGNEAQARCHAFGPQGFDGEHQGFGQPVRRRLRITDDAIVVEDFGLPPGRRILTGRDETLAYFDIGVEFCPGYGKRLSKEPPCAS